MPSPRCLEVLWPFQCKQRVVWSRFKRFHREANLRWSWSQPLGSWEVSRSLSKSLRLEPRWELSLTLSKLLHPELQHPVTNRSKWMFLRPMGRDSTCRFKMNRYGKKKKRRDQHVGGGSQNCKVTNIAIYNGNSIEWSSIRSVIKRVINKIRRPRSGSPIYQSLVWLLTELDDTKSCCQLIIVTTVSEK